WKRGTYVLLPVLRPDMDLDWASYEGPDSLRAGPRGLTEPAEPPRGIAAVSRADLVIVPALAVDRRGVRLRRGGGRHARAPARGGPPGPPPAPPLHPALRGAGAPAPPPPRGPRGGRGAAGSGNNAAAE